jgi:hypothetical protein
VNPLEPIHNDERNYGRTLHSGGIDPPKNIFRASSTLYRFKKHMITSSRTKRFSFCVSFMWVSSGISKGHSNNCLAASFVVVDVRPIYRLLNLSEARQQIELQLK